MKPKAKTVSIHVGGATYQVKASVPAAELHRLAERIEGKLRELDPSYDPEQKSVNPQTFVLVAMAMAHDVEALESERDQLREQLDNERNRRSHSETSTRDFLRRMINRIDAALDEGDSDDPSADTDDQTTQSAQNPGDKRHERT